MCDYCKLPIYIKVQQLLRSALAPLTPEAALMDEVDKSDWHGIRAVREAILPDVWAENGGTR